MRLQRTRRRESQLPRSQNRALDLPAGEIGHADVTDLARPHEHVEGSESLLYRCRRIPLVGLIQINVVGSEALQAGFASANDPATRQTLGVAAVVHPATAFGRQYH